MTHHYKRNGTLDLFAALNVGSGEVLHDTRRSHTGRDVPGFSRRVDMHVAPDLGLHVILDNLSAHKKRRWHLHSTPTSSSWLNLLERWSSVLSRKALTNTSFTSVANSKPGSPAGPPTGTTTPNPSSGPNPPTRSSTKSPADEPPSTGSPNPRHTDGSGLRSADSCTSLGSSSRASWRPRAVRTHGVRESAGFVSTRTRPQFLRTLNVPRGTARAGRRGAASATADRRSPAGRAPAPDAPQTPTSGPGSCCRAPASD
ncbi:hypothetical protein DIZ27_38320 [Streptomyces sp. NWU339]|uniref:transposase n=1 Tax=Streptomyces sp. NWU339 TaxID=2185284 RepID=UPI000D676BAD|nr:hypothetical protein DIZ27_38320 [Streptomyces sp. NWU339]